MKKTINFYLQKTRKIEAVLEGHPFTRLNLEPSGIYRDLEKLGAMLEVIETVDIGSMRSSAEDEDNWVYQKAKKMFKKNDWFLDMLKGEYRVMIRDEE